MSSYLGRYLYVAQFDEYAKVGVTVDLSNRLAWYRWRARKDEVTFTPLLALPLHLNAGANEHATVRHFLPSGQEWTEYLTIDPREVVAFARELPRMEPAPRPHPITDKALPRLAARYGFEVAS